MHFLLAGKVLLSLETQTEMSMEYDSTECEFWCQIAKVRSTEQFEGYHNMLAPSSNERPAEQVKEKYL